MILRALGALLKPLHLFLSSIYFSENLELEVLFNNNNKKKTYKYLLKKVWQDFWKF